MTDRATYSVRRPPRIMFTGGGTGGHVYPAIAIANAVRRLRPDAVIAFAGSKDRLEWTAVPKAGYPIHAVSVQGLQRRLTARNLTLPFTVSKGLFQSLRLVKAFDADVAVGTGGYVSGPVIWASHKRHRPIVIQEQNAFVGVTNRILSRYATRIHTAFPETLTSFPADKTRVTGNPVRESLLNVDSDAARGQLGLETGQRVLLVLGGSGGSLAINESVRSHISDFLSDPDLVLIWQTGSRYYDRVTEGLGTDERVRVKRFIDRMDLAYAVADLVICRAGALTCSELLLTGRPSILIPSPNVAEDHQTKNADSMNSIHAACVLGEHTMDEQLVGLWRELWSNEDRLRAMSTAARAHAKPDAAEQIARDILKIADSGRKETREVFA